MRCYYDCEFLEDGKTIELISIGMVREDGKELYLINREAPWSRIAQHKWLVKHVMPYLPVRFEEVADRMGDGPPAYYPVFIHHPDYERLMPHKDIAHEVSRFLDVPNPSLWAWYGAYDHVCLAQLYGPMSSMPPHIPYITCDVRQEHLRMGGIPLPKQAPGTHHHALYDARHVKVMHEFLQGLEKT